MYVIMYLLSLNFLVGGIKEKVLAAHRAGISHVILPRRNEKDLKELPQAVKVSRNFFTDLASNISAYY